MTPDDVIRETPESVRVALDEIRTTPGADRPPISVTEFTDPACPWAWGSEPVFRLLRLTLGSRAHWRPVFGILFDEDDDPAPDPAAEARWYERFIREVTAHTDAPRAPRLHWLTRSSLPASLAAKAAGSQGPEVAERVLRRLRESTFVLGTPADTPDAIRAVVRGVPGLDSDRLLAELAARETRDAVRADWTETRRPIPEVLDLQGPGPHPGRAKEVGDHRRYALPTLLFDGPGGRVCVPGWRPLETYLEAARRAAGDRLPLTPVRLPATAALERWRSLTGPELALLTEESTAPAEAVRVDTGHGPLWLHPDEAHAREQSSFAVKAQVAGVSDNETPRGVH
ncbi:DsbA family protein [Streptomyces sp. 35G-GA-8]|uniref:DsbA family oxidoreductase n=1 Tax=Streptomyces sp. 35G-GA-8 TaxID=2939434 RepID=UPI00201F7E92|nr:DsbA family protein [Streptomyces sp. 35G-GA-8]MCL7378460.1 DsbA family protein [Streptomyces sp. 35G-GA-8]